MGGVLTYRLFDLVARRRVVPALARLLEQQSWPSARLEAHAAQRLASLLRHARDQVPFYRGRVAPGGPPHLASFPLLDKTILRDQAAELLAQDADRRTMRQTSSGGSTGAPAPLWLDGPTLDAQSAAALRHQAWMGLGVVCPHLLLWGPPPGVVTYGTLSGRLKGILLRRRFVPTYGLDEGGAARIRERLRRACPEQVIGYSSALDLISAGAAPLARSPRAVVAAAEILHPAQRARIARFFGAPVFERYGCNEFSALAHDCSKGRLHVNTDRVVLEIIRPDGKPAARGELGEAVVTDLDNRGMPLIRLRLGDVLEADSACDCGLPFPTVGPVHGRVADLVQGAAGGVVSPRQVAMALQDCGGVLEHQVRVGREGAPEVLVKTLGDFDEKGAARGLAALFGRQVPVKRVGTVPRWPSGKVRSVVREDLP